MKFNIMERVLALKIHVVQWTKNIGFPDIKNELTISLISIWTNEI